MPPMAAVTRVDEATSLVTGETVTGNYFELLGLRPVRGRLLAPEDDRPSAPRVAVISSGLWERAFGRDPDVVGRTLYVRTLPYVIVGVAPPEFYGMPPIPGSRRVSVFRKEEVRLGATELAAWRRPWRVPPASSPPCRGHRPLRRHRGRVPRPAGGLSVARLLPSYRGAAATASAISPIEKNTKSVDGIGSTRAVAPQLPPAESRCRSIQALASPNRFAGTWS